MAQLNLILLGPPGAGKGTQAERLVDDFDLAYYATGDILRAAVKEESELGRRAGEYMERGDLVPDEVVVGLVVDRIERSEAQDGFLLDGFPRNPDQARTVDDELSRLGRQLTAVLLIELADGEVIRRLSGRRMCVKNGHLYHAEFDPPKREGVCDQDGSRLVQRDDDHPDTVKHRLEVYREHTSPLAELYEERGLLRRFDGSRSTSEVHDHIRASLATLRLESEL